MARGMSNSASCVMKCGQILVDLKLEMRRTGTDATDANESVFPDCQIEQTSLLGKHRVPVGLHLLHSFGKVTVAGL